MLISVVGNASSIFDKKNGVLIDSADLVIRCTFGVPVRKESQGKRIDIVVTSLKQKKDYPVFRGDFDYWWTGHSDERSHLFKVLGYQPSNGIIALEMVKNKYPDADVQIFGFDWKVTRTFYMTSPIMLPKDKPNGWFHRTEKHDYAGEKKYCLQLIKDCGWSLF